MILNLANVIGRKDYSDSNSVNDEAVAELQRMASRNEKLIIKYGVDRNSYPYIWVESYQTSGFKVCINSELLTSIYHYLKNGEPIDCTSHEVKKYEAGDKYDFRECVLKELIEAGRNIQFVPRFRDKPREINACAQFSNGRMHFQLKRTDELISYLEKKELI